MGLLSFLFGNKKQTEPEQIPSTDKKSISSYQATEFKPRLPLQYPKPDIVIPEWKDGAERYNCYRVKIKVTDGETLVSHALAKDYMLEPKEIDGEFHLLSSGADIGILLDRDDMLRDWIVRGDPYFLCLEHVLKETPEEGCTGQIAFYRDKRKGQEWREQTVTPLTAYRSDQKQSLIWDIKEGAHLVLRKDSDYADSVVVIWQGSVIGKLTKNQAKRYLEEGAYSAFFERREYDKDYKDKPYIRIYWKNRNKETEDG